MHTRSPEPAVSVVMGICYRRPNLDLLERSISSILSQTVQNMEVLICEYGSTDRARLRLSCFAAEDDRVRILQGSSPGTLAQNLNRCLVEAKGNYIARMDDDDFSCPDRFAKQLAYLGHHPDIDYVGCNVELCRNGEQIGMWTFPEFPEIHDFYIRQPYVHPSLIFRREALDAVGGYSEDRRCVLCEDYDLLLRMTGKGMQGANLQEPLLTYTVPSTSKGNRKMRHRWNETVTRYKRFKELGMLPGAFPYVIKPLAVGLLPAWTLKAIKEKRMEK